MKREKRDNHMAPAGEQVICVNCGLCCDATLFLFAALKPDERGHLPEKLEAASVTRNGGPFFKLPCPCFNGKCTIYDQERAFVCSAYRCRILKDYAVGKISHVDALTTVKEAKAMRDAIMQEYRRISGNDSYTGFRQLMQELGKIVKEAEDERAGDDDGYSMLVARCNILDALLIKVFISAEQFEKYIMK